jgi:uncharacterized protein YabN with tetrapyrrole methylase and pyrophosphatase domain
MVEINKAITSESIDEMKKVELMFTHLHEHLEYMTKLMESVVEQFSLANKAQKNMSDLADLNNQFMKSLFEGKEFQGKEEFIKHIDKITRMGAGK